MNQYIEILRERCLYQRVVFPRAVIVNMPNEDYRELVAGLQCGWTEYTHDAQFFYVGPRSTQTAPRVTEDAMLKRVADTYEKLAKQPPKDETSYDVCPVCGGNGDACGASGGYRSGG
jgi:hypothetical protein